MKNSWKKFLSIVSVFTLITMIFTPTIAGAQTSKSFNKEVDELAGALEFVFEEATIKDQNGNPIGLDIELIEEKFGSSPELEEIKKAMEQKQPLSTCDSSLVGSVEVSSTGPITIQNAYVDCVADKLGDWAGDFVPTTLIASVMEYLNDGDYYNAALKIARAGIKGSVWGIAGSLGWIVIECNWDK